MGKAKQYAHYGGQEVGLHSTEAAEQNGFSRGGGRGGKGLDQEEHPAERQCPDPERGKPRHKRRQDSSSPACFISQSCCTIVSFN